MNVQTLKKAFKDVFEGVQSEDLMNKPVFVMNGMPNVPALNPHYIPNAGSLEVALAWIYQPKRNLSLALYGETGTGKTEFVSYLANRLGFTLHRVSVSESMRPETLKGGTGIKNGETYFQESVVVKAYREGGILLLDELDKGSCDLHAALHPILEGKPLAIEKTGEVVEPHPLFRVIATCQTPGLADFSGRYTSLRGDMDEAVRRRFIWVGFQYPSVLDDVEILGRTAPKIPYTVRLKMSNFAAECRQAMTADAIDMENIDLGAGINKNVSSALSTRVLVDWANMCMALRNRPLANVFDLVFANACEAAERQTFIELAELKFGADFNKPMSELLVI